MVEGDNYDTHDHDDDDNDVNGSRTTLTKSSGGAEVFEKKLGKVNLVLLKRLEKLLLNSKKPFNHTIGDVLSILEDNCGSVEFEQHSQRLVFRIDCTEYVCSCLEVPA